MGFAKIELWALPRGADPYPLPHLRSWQLSPTDGDVGLLEFVYPDTGRGFADLERCADDDIDLEVEVTVRPLDGRPPWQDIAIVDEADLDDVADTGVATFRGRLLGAVFDEAVVPYHPTGDQGETAVTGTAGRVAREFLEAAQARGCFPRVTWTFTDDLDSNGQPWERQATLRFNPGQTYRAVLGTLRGYQLGEWEITPEWELRIVNVDLEDGYGLGVDRTLGANPLTLERGRDLGDAPRKWRVRDAITALVSSGKDGLYASASDATAQARRGRRIEGYHSFGNTADAGTLAALTQRRLGTQTRGRIEVSHKVELSESGPTPLIDFAEGDRVYSATRKGVAKRRVRQVTLSGDADNVQSCAVTCGDLLDEAAVRQQEQLDAIANGEAIAGTSTPPPETDDGSTPAAPAGMTVSSLWYATNEGAGASQATAVWQPVPDTRVRGYVLEWRYPGSMDWSPLPEVPGTSVSWSSLRPGAVMETRVAAVNKWDRRSPWSQTYTVTLETDGTPPPRLSTPTPYPALGLLVVPWDGRGSVGEAMPGDFLAAEVHISPTSGFTAHRPLLAGSKHIDTKASSTYAGELRAGGELPVDVGTAAYGTTAYVVLVAKDRTGNAAQQSVQASVVPRAVQDGEIAELNVGKLRTGILTALVAVAGRLYAGDPNGAGWEGDPSGFRFWGMRGTTRIALLEFIAATSRLVLRGTFEALGDGNAAIGIYPESLPVLRLWSPSGAFGPAFLNAFDIGGAGGTGLGINSSAQAATGTAAQRLAARYSRVFLEPERARVEVVNGNQAIVGGTVDLGRTFAYLTARHDGSTLAAEDVNQRGVASKTLYDTAGVRRAQLYMQLGGEGAPGNDPIIELHTFNSAGTRTAFIRLLQGSVQIIGNTFINNQQVVAHPAGSSKTFVIPHPLDAPDQPERWLVHAATESPVAGVEYTGTAEVDELAAVTLPDYFDALVEDDGRTVQVTVVDDGGPLALVAASPIEGGRFFIRTNADRPVRVHWHVRGARRDASGFEVEPRRSDYHARGDGPYRYLIPKEGRAA